MQQYRLHIDMPLGTDENAALDKANAVMKRLLEDQNKQYLTVQEIPLVNYRVGHDQDLYRTNHLIENKSGYQHNKDELNYRELARIMKQLRGHLPIGNFAGITGSNEK